MADDAMDAQEIRARIKGLILDARTDHPNFDYLGEVDELDVLIEALIHPETFEVMVRVRD